MRQIDIWAGTSDDSCREQTEAQRKIACATDGPVTVFVAISRAITLAREEGPRDLRGPFYTDPIAEALNDLLPYLTGDGIPSAE